MIHQDLKKNPVKNEKPTRKMKNPLNNFLEFGTRKKSIH
jgi:hypothetical protein